MLWVYWIPPQMDAIDDVQNTHLKQNGLDTLVGWQILTQIVTHSSADPATGLWDLFRAYVQPSRRLMHL